MNMKKLNQKQIIKILLLTAAGSIILLGLVTWIFNIPAYFTGEKGSYPIDSKNTVSVDLNKTYDIDDITAIDVKLFYSDIDVTVSNDDTISFVFSGKVNSRPKMEEPYLVFTDSAGKLVIRTTTKNTFSVMNSTLVLKISVPEKKLNELILSTSSGYITVFGNSAEKMSIDTSSGRAAVNGYNGEYLKLDSSSGDNDMIDVHVDKLTISSSSGDIIIDNSSSVETRISTSSGDVDIRQFVTEENQLETTSGEVNIEAYSGNLNFSSSSGYLNAAFDKEGDEIIVETSSGDVTLQLGRDSGFKLDTDTSSGEFEIGFPVTLEGNYDQDSISGSVGDGVGLVKINTSSGDIIINSK